MSRKKSTESELPVVRDLAETSQTPTISKSDEWDQLFDPEVFAGDVVELEAAAPELEQAAPVTIRYLGFRLGSEYYAVPILNLSEVVRCQEITAVPRVRSFVRGIISVRGAIVPIVDLQQRLAQSGEEEGSSRVPFGAGPAGARASDRRVLITRHEGEAFGLLVDAVSDVFVLEPGEIEPPPATLPRRLLEFVSGIARVQGRIHTVLEVPAVLRFQAVARAFRGTEAVT
ncbi:MAG: chemotaxis protein CheW [bacterium]